MDDTKLTEEAVCQELTKLNDTITDPEYDSLSEVESISVDDQVTYELPESVLSCFQLERNRLDAIERQIMENTEEKDSAIDEIREGIPNDCDEFLKELASECGEDPIKFKERIISEIEKEESQSTLCTEDPQSASDGNAAEQTAHEDEENSDSDEYVETERQFKIELMNLERRLKAEEERRMAENKAIKERHLRERKEEEERRIRRHRFFEEELRRIENDNIVEHHFKIDVNKTKLNERITQELSKQQELIAGLQKHVVEERQAFEEAQADQKRKTEEKQRRAATKIQASVRAFLLRTKNAMLLSGKREERRQETEAKLRLEKERKEKEEKLKKLEEQRIRHEEEKRKREEERMRQMEESKRKEEERIKQMEEARRKEEERAKHEEEKKREEEERKKKEEEDCLVRERKQKQEEEKRKEEEEARKREEEERKKKEEEDRLVREWKQKQEEEKHNEEEEARKREEEERKKKEEEDHLEKELKQKQEEEKRKEEEEARKRDEEIRKNEEQEGKQRIAEEHIQREIEEKKAEELREKEDHRREQVEEEQTKQQQEEEQSRQLEQEESRMEEDGEIQLDRNIPEEEQNQHGSCAEHEKDPQSQFSEELEQTKSQPQSDNAASDTDQSEEELYDWRKGFYGSDRSSRTSSPDETPRSASTVDVTEQNGTQAEELTATHSDEAKLRESERQVPIVPNRAAQKCVEPVKDISSATKSALQAKRKLVLKSTVARRGSELTVGQPDQQVDQADQSGTAEDAETGATIPALLVCKKRAAVQDDRKEEWKKKKEQQQQMEKERREKEERARKKAEELRRRREEEERERHIAEEEEQAHLEEEQQVEEEEEEEREEKQCREMEERKAEELREQECERRREEESQKQSKEPLAGEGGNPQRLDVGSEKMAPPASDPHSGAGELAQIQQGTEREGPTLPADGLLSVSAVCLPDSAEHKRLQWMRDCVPWAKLSLQNKRKQPPKTKTVRRASVKLLPPLSAETILQCSVWSSLKQVTTVTLEDLPGCSLSTLSECAQLQTLTMRRCGLVALEGLSGCRALRYIDLQENEIKYVNCQDLSKLRVLLLSRNQLTVIHGLEDAADLDVLDLSHNRISRISGLESLKRLQRLLIDHNQLISTRGLQDMYTLLHLDCGYNHLTNMSDLDNCALLNTLKLQGNNLTEPPSLKNHVLMRELHLDDNIISSLDSLAACWLPLLQLISASKNSITHLPPLHDCVSLQKLDISHNCLSELENVRQSLMGCLWLEEIHLLGNPFQQESNWRSSLLQTVPGLRRINGEWISSTVPPTGRAGNLAPGTFLGFCRAQLQQLQMLQSSHETQVSGAPCPRNIPAIFIHHYEELLLLAEEHRYGHEFGDLIVTDRTELNSPGRCPDQDIVASAASQAIAAKAASRTMVASRANVAGAGSISRADQGIACSAPCSQEVGKDGRDYEPPEPSASTKVDNTMSKSIIVPSERNTSQLQDGSKTAKDRPAAAKPAKKRPQKLDLKNMAAVVIQSFWRGHRCRRDALWHADRSAAGGDGSSSAVTAERRLELCRAATVIQAVWKGYVLRKRLASALAAVRNTETEEEFAEVDVDEFAFDEAALDRDWLTLDSERSPSRTQPLCERPLWPKPPAQQPQQRTSPAMLMWQPRQAWPGGESERMTHSERHSVSLEIAELIHRAKLPLACGFGPPREKSDKIMKEWGLRDMYTVQLMLKRAQKMKPKKRRDRRAADPAVCLDLFRTNENKQTPVKVPRRNLPEKIQTFKDCFAAVEEGFEEQKRLIRERTDLWVQTQDNNADTDRSSPNTENDHFLPEIDLDVRNGRRVQLVSVSAHPRRCQAGPGHRAGPDQESGSWASTAALSPPRKEHNQTRGDTVGHAKKEAPAPVPAGSGPIRKERISFRDNPVQLSQGWGGGKKRSKPNK